MHDDGFGVGGGELGVDKNPLGGDTLSFLCIRFEPGDDATARGPGVVGYPGDRAGGGK